jgi:Reverse transcriptase (RNA-dependent DNA polymerase)
MNRNGVASSCAIILLVLYGGSNQWLQSPPHKPAVDFRKAFDRVDRTTALRKMAELNIDDIFLRWMRSYLSDRRQRVKVGNVVSPWLRPNDGMPQGMQLLWAICVSNHDQ